MLQGRQYLNLYQLWQDANSAQTGSQQQNDYNPLVFHTIIVKNNVYGTVKKYTFVQVD